MENLNLKNFFLCWLLVTIASGFLHTWFRTHTLGPTLFQPVYHSMQCQWIAAPRCTFLISRFDHSEWLFWQQLFFILKLYLHCAIHKLVKSSFPNNSDLSWTNINPGVVSVYFDLPDAYVLNYYVSHSYNFISVKLGDNTVIKFRYSNDHGFY